MKRKLTVITIIIGLFLVLSLAASAETQKKTVVQDLVENPDNITLVVRITWETGELKTTLISPSGKRIPLVSGTPDTMVTQTGTSIEAYIYNPEIGKWQIEFTGGGNGKVKAQTTKIVEPLKVTNIQVSQNAGTNDIALSFTSTGDRQTSGFNYEVYLITDQKDMEGKLITSGTSTVGNTENLTISLNEVNTFSQYYIRINATCVSNGIQDFDSSVSQAFTFNHKDDLPPVKGLITDINADDRTISLVWQAQDENTVIDGYRINIYKDDELVPFISEDLSADILNYIAQYEETAKKLRAEVSVLRGGIAGQPAKAEITIVSLTEAPVQFTLPQERVTSHSDLRLPFKVIKPAKIVIKVNDKESSYDVKTDGVFTLKLQPDTNHVQLMVYVSDQSAVSKDFDIILDDAAPQLNIYEDISGLRVSGNQIVILGSSEQSAIVTVNNNPVTMDEQGNFTYESKLHLGKNTIIVDAKDGAGNISEYKATVTRIIDFNGTYYILIAGLLLTAIALLVYWLKGRKKS